MALALRAAAGGLLLAACPADEGDGSSGTAGGPGTTSASTSASATSEDPTGGPESTSSTSSTGATTDATDAASTSSTSTTTSTTGDTTTGGDPGLDPDAPPVTEGRWYRPGPGTTWQYQLTGDLVTAYDAELWGIDLFDTDTATIAGLQAEGRRVICYFSAGSGEDWRPDHDQIDPSALGEPLDGWPGERWLDFRHPSVQEVMRGRLDLAVEKGCDGVDPDNVDGYTQASGFEIGATDQIAYNRWLANRAHERGLAVGLKNDLEQIVMLVDYVDFQVNEQCHEYEECDLLQPFVAAGKPAFNVEYPGGEAEAAALAPELCPQALAADLRTIMAPYDLDGSWRVSCD